MLVFFFLPGFRGPDRSSWPWTVCLSYVVSTERQANLRTIGSTNLRRLWLFHGKGARRAGCTLRKGVFLPSKPLLSIFYDPPPQRTLLRTSVLTETLARRLLRTLLRSTSFKEPSKLSDPRHRNHKSLAIANHNFEVASFSRRNRNEIAVLEVFSESQ